MITLEELLLQHPGQDMSYFDVYFYDEDENCYQWLGKLRRLTRLCADAPVLEFSLEDEMLVLG
jgi:hypothetical protein